MASKTGSVTDDLRNRAEPLNQAAMRARYALLVPVLALAASPALARDALGVFGQWGAFRDPGVPRCYAIAVAEKAAAGDRRARQPFATIGTWPKQQLRGQLHLRLSRDAAAGKPINLVVGSQRFVLTGGGADAWAADRRMDAAVVAAMRSAAILSVSATDAGGRRFTDRYPLAGAASAMDAATLGCARIR